MGETVVLYVAELPDSGENRRERAHRLSAAARRLLARGISELYGIPSLPVISRNENGKPFFAEYPDIHFNISHSGLTAVCAIAPVNVGVDIQEMESNPSRLIRRFGGEELYKKYEDAADREAFFLSWWTREESYAKYLGSTLAACIGGEKIRCRFWQVRLRNKCYCTVCTEREISVQIREL